MSEKVTLRDFDISEYLDSKEVIAEYISQILQDGNMSELLSALGYIAKAKGLNKIAKNTGLGRESLYKVFQPNAKPRFETILKILNSLDIKLKAVV